MSTPTIVMVDTGSASTGFMIVCSALVLIMTPAVGLLYSGLSRSKNALSQIMLSFLTMGIVTIQWVLFGFSLSFSEDGNPSVFIGNFQYGGLVNVGASPLHVASSIPSALFCLFQMQVAIVTAAIIFGSPAERIRFLPALVFAFLWTTLVYDPVTYWTFAHRGWIRNMACISSASNGVPCGSGVYDYAGGGPVHMACGFAGLAYALMIGPRKGYKQQPFHPHNLTNVFIGTGLLWFGWYGFNGGSAFAATPRAAMTALVTTISGACAAMSWTISDYLRTGRFSAFSICSGVLAGLVVITPGSGFVAPWAAIIIGLIGGVVVSYALHIKEVLGFDDALDAFGFHGMGGLLGNILAGIFASKSIAALDGTVIDGGWIDGHFVQIGYQLASSVAIGAWSFFITAFILLIMNKIPGLAIRSSSNDEAAGNDVIEMGENAYELLGKSSLKVFPE